MNSEPSKKVERPPRPWPPTCPNHPDEVMYVHPKRWAWLCQIERGRDLPSPQPSWVTVSKTGKWSYITIPFDPPFRARRPQQHPNRGAA